MGSSGAKGAGMDGGLFEALYNPVGYLFGNPKIDPVGNFFGSVFGSMQDSVMGTDYGAQAQKQSEQEWNSYFEDNALTKDRVAAAQAVQPGTVQQKPDINRALAAQSPSSLLTEE